MNNKQSPTIENISEYLALLNKDLPDRIRASSLILKLARYHENLDALEQNAELLSTLAGILREDSQKSVELATNIMYIFFCFSGYSQFHHVIGKYRIGSLCMDVIDFELKEYEKMQHEATAGGRE